MKKLFFLMGWSWMSALAFAGTPFDGLTGLDGKPAVLDDTKDQRLVVFWGTWCEDCRVKLGKELLELDRRKDLSVITVNTDRDNDRVREFVSKEKITLPVLRDPSKELRRELGVYSVPHWALYRKKAGRYERVASEAAFDTEQVLKALAAGGPQ
jgi:thiol-disulfide isomerase/thioredoxin